MTFSTQKRKIFTMWNGSIKNQFVIDELSSNDKIIFTKINELNRSDTVYNNVIDFSSEFTTPLQAIDFNEDTADFINEIAGEHSVVFNGITTNMMPYIQSKVAYRMGDSQVSLPIPIERQPFIFDNIRSEWDNEFDFNNYDNFKINSIIEIVPITNENGEEDESLGNKITYRTSFFQQFADVFAPPGQETGFPIELQIKFYVSIINPMYFQST